ncbi:MAG: methyltransferase [Bacteroidota bacterium]|nr:methyltransferase [Bacteroidota bacterium]
MRKIIKAIVNRTWKPMVENYLSVPRVYNFRRITVNIPPGVFHPGFFFSTKLLITFLEKQQLSGKRFLEMGSGSGMISIFAAQQKAVVTACDISPLAVECTLGNAKNNGVSISVFQSDLFSSLPAQQFDIIAVNPPYYKKNPASIAENAWYCGENLEYFRAFFCQAKKFISASSDIFMVLSDECDLHGIQAIANENDLTFTLCVQKRTMWEQGFIFNIRLNEK